MRDRQAGAGLPALFFGRGERGRPERGANVMKNLETTPATQAAQIVLTPARVVRRSVAILGGALLVAVAAQFAVPLPGTPVPLTLQVPAVLLVAGLLGPRAGAASMAVYLGLGIAGLPVFAPIRAQGFARLPGPPGG